VLDHYDSGIKNCNTLSAVIVAYRNRAAFFGATARTTEGMSV
jgi:hypothetical protein